MFWPDDPDDALRIVGQGRLEVVFNEKKGYVYLVDNREVPGIDEYLDELAGIGLLESNVEDNNVIIDNNLPIYETIICPECGSPNIVRESLAQHEACGTVLPISSFEVGDRLFCPACNTEITRGELLDLGSWYICHSCGNRFQQPLVRFNHGDKQVKLGFEVVTYKKNYSLTPRGLSALNAPATNLEINLKKALYKKFNVFYVGSFLGKVGHVEEVDIFYDHANRPHQILVLKGNSEVSANDLKSALDRSKSTLYYLSYIVISPYADDKAKDFLKHGNFPYAICKQEDRIADVVMNFLADTQKQSANQKL
ncbi:MAG: hypothetical protein ACP5UU_01110 [Thermoprotei archaeon]